MADLPPNGPPQASGGVLSKKLWGLPTWGWIAIAAAGGVVAFMWLQSRKKSSDTSSTDTSSTDDTGLAGEHDQDLYATIRDLQGQISVPTTTGGDTTTTPTAATPAAVTGLKATRVSTDTIWLTWKGSVGARGYDVQWTDAQNHTGNGTALLPGYVMAGLPRGEKYMIKVRAKHDLAPLGTSTDGPWTSPIQVTTHRV